jgi:hypothetical protein
MTDLRERAELWARACKAFTPEFRAALADACQREFHRIGVCYCPQAALVKGTHSMPSTSAVSEWCSLNGFEECSDQRTHYHFQFAFDNGYDFGTPESALGLLYRERFVGRERLKARGEI